MDLVDDSYRLAAGEGRPHNLFFALQLDTAAAERAASVVGRARAGTA